MSEPAAKSPRAVEMVRPGVPPEASEGKRIPELVRELLVELGEDPGREGLLKTPARVAESLGFLTGGYDKDPVEVVDGALYDVDYEDMVLVKDVDFFSLCEHHLLPFFGRCHVAYLPDRRIVGLSKIPRLIDVYARRLQVQERLTCQIAGAIDSLLTPRGVAVIMEAAHLCMSMRGVEQQNASTKTSTYLGAFRESESLRSELLKLLTRN